MNSAPLLLMSFKHILFHRLLHEEKKSSPPPPPIVLLHFLHLHFQSFRRLQRVLPCKSANDLLKGPLIIAGFIPPACLEVSARLFSTQ